MKVGEQGWELIGPDYVQWHGFYELLKDRIEIEHMAEELRKESIKRAADVGWVAGFVAIIVAVMLRWKR